MLIKFFSHGRGDGGGPVNYVTRTEGREHEPPEVLRGDPEQTRDLIDSIDRQWRYTSGVVSFSREDAPSVAEQEKVMDDFEATAFAGLESDQYDCLWVRHAHTDGGRIELHFVTAAHGAFDGQGAEHRAARLVLALWASPRRAELRARLGPSGRSGPCAVAAARP